MSTPRRHFSELAWLSAYPEDRRFRIITLAVLSVTMAVSITIPFIPVPDIAINKHQPIPQRFAKLVLEKKKVTPQPQKKTELTEEEKLALKKADEERRKKLDEERKKREEELKKQREEEKKKAEEERKKAIAQQQKSAEQLKADEERRRQEQIRRQAIEAQQRVEAEKQRVAAEKQKGAEAATALFSDLADLSNEKVPAAQSTKLLASNQPKTTGSAKPGFASPNILSSKTATAGKGTGGIDTKQLAAATTGAGAIALESRAATVMKEVNLGVIDPKNASDSKVNAKGEATRSARELNVVLERNKGRIDNVYQRALRQDPTLGGKVVVRLTIAPSGEVQEVQIVSSEIQSDDFLAKLKTLLKGLNFGQRDTPTVIANYPLDFGML